MWGNRVPSEDYRTFIESCDMVPAYRHHKRTLQVLQSDAPGRWVLKMPAHAYFIDGLLAVYPEAKIIWTHRDPYKSVASFLDLGGFAHTLSLGEPDRESIRSTYPPRLADYIRRAEAALADHNVHHVRYCSWIPQILELDFVVGGFMCAMAHDDSLTVFALVWLGRPGYEQASCQNSA